MSSFIYAWIAFHKPRSGVTGAGEVRSVERPRADLTGSDFISTPLRLESGAGYPTADHTPQGDIMAQRWRFGLALLLATGLLGAPNTPTAGAADNNSGDVIIGIPTRGPVGVSQSIRAEDR